MKRCVVLAVCCLLWGMKAGALTQGDVLLLAEQNGNLHAFVVYGGHISHAWQDSVNGWSLTGVVQLPGAGGIGCPPNYRCNLSGILDNAGRLWIFGTSGNTVYYFRESCANCYEQWDARVDLTGTIATSFPSVAKDTDGRLEIFAEGNAHDAIHDWQDANGVWQPWESLGAQTFTDNYVAAATNAVGLGGTIPGSLEIFISGHNDADSFANWQISAGGGWYGWRVIENNWQYGYSDGIAAAMNKDGRLEIFSKDSRGVIIHNWQTSPAVSGNPGDWSGWGYWINDQRPNGKPSITKDVYGCLTLHVISGSSAVLQAYQFCNGDWSWSLFGYIGGSSFQVNSWPINATAGDGHIEVTAMGPNDYMYVDAQTCPGCDSWSGWNALGHP